MNIAAGRDHSLAIEAMTWRNSGWVKVNSIGDLSSLIIYGNRSDGGLAALPAALGAGIRHILCHSHSSNTWYTGIAVANSSIWSEANVTLTAYDDAGSVVGRTNLSVPARGKVSEYLESLFGSKIGKGWIDVDSDVPVAAFEVYGDRINGGIAALPGCGSSDPAILPHFHSSDKWWTGVSVVNPYNNPISVTLNAYGNDGTHLDGSTWSVPAKGKLAGRADQLLSVANATGWIMVEAQMALNPVPVPALVVYGDSTTSPAEFAAVTSSLSLDDRHLATFYSNSKWWTSLSLVNPNVGSTITATLRAYTSDGDLIEGVIQSIPPMNKLVGKVSDLLDLGGNETGWVEVSTSSPVVGMQVIHADDGSLEMWGLGAASPQGTGSPIYLSHYNASAKWRTLFALANPADGTRAGVTLRAFGPEGSLSGMALKTINPNGRMFKDVKTLFEIP